MSLPRVASSARPASGAAWLRVVAVLALLVGVLAWSGGSPGSAARADPPAVPQQGPYLGAILDWQRDSPADYRDRLGRAPAAYGFDAPMPLADDDVAALRVAVDEATAQGGALMVTLLPTQPLDSFDDAAVEQLVDALAAAGVGDDVPAWVRPMPEMNASWLEWGQQPREFRDVFTRLSRTVHERLDRTAMVWKPVYGAGYPFGAEARTSRRDAGPAAEPALDTDGDGRLTLRDDPYGPYWPGAAAVDWVGLSLFHWGESYPFVTNVLPPPHKLLDQLAGRYGYPDSRDSARRDFYGRFVQGADRPMVLETAALYAPASGGPSELALKRAWFDQVADPRVAARYPGIAMVLWQELRRPEAESRGQVVDWRATHTRPLADAFGADLVAAAGLTTGPPGPSPAGNRDTNGPAAGADRPGTVLAGRTAVLTSTAAGLAGVGLVAATAAHRRRRWSYPDPVAGPAGALTRDLRIDLLRGIAICFVVVDHIAVPSLWQLLTQEAIGPVSGAELFVLFSGVVLGVVYGPRVTGTTEWYDAATRMWARALKLWATALAVIVLVYLLALLPGLDARVVTTFTDQGTGGAGGGARGRIYDLYAGFSSLTDFPVPGWALRDVLLLRMGPSQVNIIGLYVVLLLVAPLMAYLLLRRWWLPLLLLSAAAYTVAQVHPVKVLPSQFENPFPLLNWQFLFVIGLVAGWHRPALLRAAGGVAGRVTLVLVAALTLALLLFSWSNPYLANAYDVRLDLLSEPAFRDLYDGWFARTSLGIGRVVATLCVSVTGYVLLTRFWAPVERALGWFLLPLGQATLYVFVMHVLFVVAVANVPALTTSLWLGTLTHTVVLLALWAMVRTRFLFGVVPR
ncbi:OpgC domain-containing protein [Nocardioides mesophilus]|uniref:OpgC domain-containing protein n=1 Tax=Nocardioides mesophilus TaxID=433659 RepID=A0A7G9REX0_9ACTN|nr:OpgC domain-containing protein [Nocardioides mesophilus]QNN54145.1 OpgC domain-containing protein [Nocardioides mesophilus]